jgi:thiamine-phosphate pyrophosphorylase
LECGSLLPLFSHVTYHHSKLPMRFTLPKIYPITDKQMARRTSHLSILKELVKGGAQLVQVRDKSTPLRELMLDLKRCVEFAEARKVTLIVDDRCDLVLSCNAAGVHLGQDDLPPEAVRRLLGRDKIIGFSTHSLRQVHRSSEMPIQYIGFGPVYTTSSKKDPSPVVGISGLARACKASTKPVVAIGGIGLDQVEQVLQAGAASVAVISALMTAANPARMMELFREKARAT